MCATGSLQGVLVTTHTDATSCWRCFHLAPLRQCLATGPTRPVCAGGNAGGSQRCDQVPQQQRCVELVHRPLVPPQHCWCCHRPGGAVVRSGAVRHVCVVLYVRLVPVVGSYAYCTRNSRYSCLPNSLIRLISDRNERRPRSIQHDPSSMIDHPINAKQARPSQCPGCGHRNGGED